MSAAGARRPSRVGRRATETALLVISLASPLAAPLAEAQGVARSEMAATYSPKSQRPHEHRIPRRLLFAAIGTALGTALAVSYSGGEAAQGACSSNTCVSAVTIGSATFVGYLVGREFDQLHAIRYRVGAPLTPKAVSAPLSFSPTTITVGDSDVAVGGPGGVDVFAARRVLGTPTRRASGIRGITSLALVSPSGALVVTSPTGVFLYPPHTGSGSLVRDGAASASAAGAAGRIFFSTGTRVEVAPAAAVDSARSWPGLDLGRAVQTMTFDAARGVLWVGADSVLFALRPAGDSLERVGQLSIAAGIRRVAVSGTRLALALGEGGVRLYDSHDPAAPVEQERWTGVRFAYDVALSPQRLFVAAGGEGMYVLHAEPSDRPVIGLARDLGFVVGVETHGPDTYLLDRDGPSLHRIQTRF
ncbi:MAG TPA: hypothetical protein VFJ74_05730 [Gemmatimonadaceae bacterium]|nr:hypothetical protein [Gemmatimonadaceae bacterium]